MGHVMKASILFLGDYCQIRGLEGKSEAVCQSTDRLRRRGRAKAHLCRPVLLPRVFYGADERRKVPEVLSRFRRHGFS